MKRVSVEERTEPEEGRRTITNSIWQCREVADFQRETRSMRQATSADELRQTNQTSAKIAGRTANIPRPSLKPTEESKVVCNLITNISHGDSIFHARHWIKANLQISYHATLR